MSYEQYYTDITASKIKKKEKRKFNLFHMHDCFFSKEKRLNQVIQHFPKGTHVYTIQKKKSTLAAYHSSFISRINYIFNSKD